MNEQQLIHLVLAQFKQKGSQQPAMMIANGYYDASELLNMSYSDRQQWGVNTARYIERFLAAIQAGQTSILLEADHPPEVKVSLLPRNTWWVVSHNEGVVMGNGYTLLRTGMSLEDI